MKKEDIINMAESCGFTRTHTGEVQLWLSNAQDLERLFELVESKIERDYADTLTIAHMDGYERGRDAGRKQERALFELAKSTQELGGYDK